MKKEHQIRFFIEIATNGVEICGGERSIIPPGKYDMVLINFDGCRWLAHKVNNRWKGKTLGDWHMFVNSNRPEVTDLTVTTLTDLAKLPGEDFHKITPH